MLSRHTLRSCNCGNAKFRRAIIPTCLNYFRSQKKRPLRTFWMKLITIMKYQTICSTSLTNSSGTFPSHAIILQGVTSNETDSIQTVYLKIILQLCYPRQSSQLGQLYNDSSAFSTLRNISGTLRLGCPRVPLSWPLGYP